MLITNIDYTLDFLKVKLQEEFIRNHIKKVEKFPLQSKLRKTDTLFFFLLQYYFFNIEFTEDKDISLQNKVDAFKESTTFKESYNITFQDIYIHLTFYSFLLQNIKSYNIDKKQLYTTIKMLKNIIDDEDLNAITKKDKLADYYKKFNITTEIDKFKLIIKYEYNELSIKYLQCIEIMHFLSKKLINYKEKYVANILPYFIKNRVTKQSFRNIHKILIFNNWNNILLAGGSVLSFLMFNDVTNVNDFDLFIYGLKDEKQIYDRVLQILYLYENKPNCRFIKSEHAISILYDYKKKTIKIQIILRIYSTKEEILYGFDVDSSCVGYDGKNFVFTERFKYAFSNMTNTVDFDRMSPSYEYRLSKYARRGFSVYIPDFDISKVNFTNLTIIKNRITIDKLLIYMYAQKRYDLRQFITTIFKLHYDRIRKWYNAEEIYIYNLNGFIKNYIQGIDILLFNKYIQWIVYESDYGTKSYISNIFRKPNTIFSIDNNKFYNKETNKPFDDNYASDSAKTLMEHNQINWITHNPGQQYTNTFHKIVLEDKSKWYKGLFYDVDEKLYNELGLKEFASFSYEDILILNTAIRSRLKVNIEFPLLEDNEYYKAIELFKIKK